MGYCMKNLNLYLLAALLGLTCANTEAAERAAARRCASDCASSLKFVGVCALVGGYLASQGITSTPGMPDSASVAVDPYACGHFDHVGKFHTDRPCYELVRTGSALSDDSADFGKLRMPVAPGYGLTAGKIEPAPTSSWRSIFCCGRRAR